MSSAAEVDEMWQSVAQWLPLLKSRWFCIVPTSSLPEEPSQEEIETTGLLYDDFEGAIADLINKTDWSNTTYPLSATDYRVLYESLRVLQKFEADLQEQMTFVGQNLISHEREILKEGCNPNDLGLPLTQQLKRSFAGLIKLTNSYRSCLRARINKLTRTLVRQLNILDFPDEILMNIFYYVSKDIRPSFGALSFRTANGPSYMTRYIQNVRLTCRRFCATSSHLLIDYVGLTLEPKSLARLVKISQHPTISKGVRGFCVDLSTYYSELADKLQNFAVIWSRELYESVEAARVCRPGEEMLQTYAIEDTGLTRAEYFAMLDRCHAISEEWDKIASGPVPEANPCSEALQVCWETYEQRYRDQQQVISSGSFIQTVTGALAQLPSLRHLEFKDDRTRRRRRLKPLDEVADDPLAIAQMYINRHCVATHQWLGLSCDTPMEIIVNLLGALPGAGVTLNSLTIDMSGLCNTAQLVPGLEACESLFQVAKNLNRFSLKLGKPCFDMDHTKTSHLIQLLNPLLTGDKLTSIDIKINLHGLHMGSIGPALTSPKYHELKVLRLDGLTIHGKELVRLISGLKPKSPDGSYPGCDIILKGLYLFCGSWAVILDALRDKATHNSRIGAPSGAECNIMSPEDYERVFGRYEEFPGDIESSSTADLFISGQLGDDARNPIYSIAAITEG